MAEKQTFESFVAEERERLDKACQDIYRQQHELEQKLKALRAELTAIEAYEAVKSGKVGAMGTAKTPSRKPGARRSGIRDEILALVKSAPAGLSRAEILQMKSIVEKQDKSGAQSVSNALSALKKAGQLGQNSDGRYIAADDLGKYNPA